MNSVAKPELTENRRGWNTSRTTEQFSQRPIDLRRPACALACNFWPVKASSSQHALLLTPHWTLQEQHGHHTYLWCTNALAHQKPPHTNSIMFMAENERQIEVPSGLLDIRIKPNLLLTVGCSIQGSANTWAACASLWASAFWSWSCGDRDFLTRLWEYGIKRKNIKVESRMAYLWSLQRLYLLLQQMEDQHDQTQFQQ